MKDISDFGWFCIMLSVFFISMGFAIAFGN